MAHDHDHPHDHAHTTPTPPARTAPPRRRAPGGSASRSPSPPGSWSPRRWAGVLSGSLALVSDAGHMLTDVAALALALLAVRFAARPADGKRTFGFRRAEVLAAQANVAALVVLTAWIAWEAVDRLRNPGARIELGVMAGVAAVGLVANLLVLRWLHADHSLNARSAFLHVLGDAVSSVVVLAGAAAMWFEPGWTWIDPVLSLGISLLILWGALRLSLEIADILMEAVPATWPSTRSAAPWEGWPGCSPSTTCTSGPSRRVTTPSPPTWWSGRRTWAATTPSSTR